MLYCLRSECKLYEIQLGLGLSFIFISFLVKNGKEKMHKAIWKSHSKGRKKNKTTKKATKK